MKIVICCNRNIHNDLNKVWWECMPSRVRLKKVGLKNMTRKARLIIFRKYLIFMTKFPHMSQFAKIPWHFCKIPWQFPDPEKKVLPWLLSDAWHPWFRGHCYLRLFKDSIGIWSSTEKRGISICLAKNSTDRRSYLFTTSHADSKFTEMYLDPALW